MGLASYFIGFFLPCIDFVYIVCLCYPESQKDFLSHFFSIYLGNKTCQGICNCFYFRSYNFTLLSIKEMARLKVSKLLFLLNDIVMFSLLIRFIFVCLITELSYITVTLENLCTCCVGIVFQIPNF